MTTSELPTGSRRSGRGIKIVLAISLMLNLLVLGAIGGAVLGGRPEGPPGNSPNIARSLGLGPLSQPLGRADRAALMTAANADRAAMRAQRNALAQSARDFANVVGADPFDRVAAEAILADQSALVQGLQGRGQGALLDHLSTMSAGARADYAAALTRILERRRGRQ